MGLFAQEQPKKPPRKTPSMRKTEASQVATDSTSGSEHLVSSYDKALPPPPCDTDPSRMDYVNVDLDKMSSDYPARGSPTPAAEAGQTVIKRLKGGEGKVKDDRSEAGDRGRGDRDDSGGGDVMTTSTKRESIYANATMIAGTMTVILHVWSTLRFAVKLCLFVFRCVSYFRALPVLKWREIFFCKKKTKNNPFTFCFEISKFSVKITKGQTFFWVLYIKCL